MRRLLVIFFLITGCAHRGSIVSPTTEIPGWKKQALERIELVRKAPFTLFVRDAAGKPVPHARIRLTLVSHDFQFGTAVDAKTLLDSSENGVQYRTKLTELFNAATLENDLKMEAWYGDWPDFPRAQTFSALKWLREHNFFIRGHVLVWPSEEHISTNFKNLSTPKLRAALRNHVLTIAGETRSYIDEWDVLNEPYRHRKFIEELGTEEILQWFKLARQRNPRATLFLNDYGNIEHEQITPSERYFRTLLAYAKASHAPIDGAGLQAHFDGRSLPSPDALIKKLDELASIGLRLKLTEFDVRKNSIPAESFADVLLACFSHPAVDGIYLWGFWSGKKWVPEFSLFGADWTPTPYYEVFENLVKRVWTTKKEIIADDSGRATFEGFFGTYEASVSHNGNESSQMITFKRGAARTLTLRDRRAAR